MDAPRPMSTTERVNEAVRNLEKTYNAHLVPPNQLRMYAVSFYHWLDEICRFEEDAQLPTAGLRARPSLDVKDPLFPRCLILERFRAETREFTVHVFTDRFRYQINATPSDDSRPGYLGCSMTLRKPDAGEQWHRGSDLPDGHYTQDTWRMIQAAIIRNEMVEIECFPRRDRQDEDEAEGARSIGRVRDLYQDFCEEHGHPVQHCRWCEAGVLDEFHRSGAFKAEPETGGPALDAARKAVREEVRGLIGGDPQDPEVGPDSSTRG